MEIRDMVRMANQIAGFFAAYPHDQAVKDLMARVAQMYSTDIQLAGAFAQVMGQQGMAMGAEGGLGFAGLARQAGMFLSDPKGPRVAWLEADGWDTHTQQAPRLSRLLGLLDDGLAALRQALGAHWGQTTVLVMTPGKGLV